MSNIPKGLYRAFEDIFFCLNPYFCGKRGIGYYADNGLLRLTPFPFARREGSCKNFARKVKTFVIFSYAPYKQVCWASKNKKCRIFGTFLLRFRGKRGIRTPGTVARSPHFECGPIDHSGIFPCLSNAPYIALLRQ